MPDRPTPFGAGSARQRRSEQPYNDSREDTAMSSTKAKKLKKCEECGVPRPDVKRIPDPFAENVSG